MERELRPAKVIGPAEVVLLELALTSSPFYAIACVDGPWKGQALSS
jgi:hypothetical protein